MIIRFSQLRLSIIFLLVILLPLIQKQWLNLYLFNINNLTIYKVLYYLSGLIVPTLVIINSLNKFTYYRFNNKNKKNNISGKLLLLIAIILSTTLSFLISGYIYVNLIIFINLLLSNNEYLINFVIDKQIFFVVIIFSFLIFKKTKFLLKKVILINFFVLSIITWYSQINNSFLIDVVPFYMFKFDNLNFLNVAFLLAIEIIFYLWSYISYSSYLSDWNVPKPYKREVLPILYIAIFYILIIVYYSILFK